jgi:hypothetical protein
MPSLKPVLRIHSWGGLGSQLFAVAVASRIKLNSKRRIQIVLHTGGVTRRAPEICDLYPELDYLFVDDFSIVNQQANSTEVGTNVKLKTCIKRLFLALKFIVEPNAESDFMRIKPWTRSLRGHYSYLTITSDFLQGFSQIVSTKYPVPPADGLKSCSIHVRLGDLLTLTDKGPIDPDRIVGEFARKRENDRELKMAIYSDSLKEVIDYLPNLRGVTPSYRDIPVLQAMAECAISEEFIGTSSKISFWIIALRAKVHVRHSSIPVENLLQFQNLWKGGEHFVHPY